jgi:hypothetical protein
MTMLTGPIASRVSHKVELTDVNMTVARRLIEHVIEVLPDTCGAAALLVRIALTDWQIGAYLSTLPLKTRAEVEATIMEIALVLRNTQAHEILEDFVAKMRFTSLALG